MADYKVITRSEVNALGAATPRFDGDLNKAVLYDEMAGYPNYVVSTINSASGLQYVAGQALLAVDIRLSASINVTLTPRQSTIAAGTTSVVFDITTAGTASTGTPVYSVYNATYDGGSVTSAVINGTELTLTFPANTAYTNKNITAQVKLEIDGNEFLSNISTITQERVEVMPVLSISYTGQTVGASSGTTSDFAVTKDYITSIEKYTVSPSSASISASGQTGVTITYPENQTTSERSFTVSVTGTTVYGGIITASTSFSQSADTYVFILTADQNPVAAETTTVTFTISSSHISNIG